MFIHYINASSFQSVGGKLWKKGGWWGMRRSEFDYLTLIRNKLTIGSWKHLGLMCMQREHENGGRCTYGSSSADMQKTQNLLMIWGKTGLPTNYLNSTFFMSDSRDLDFCKSPPQLILDPPQFNLILDMREIESKTVGLRIESLCVPT